MIFYQKNLSTITIDQLTDAFLKSNHNARILHLYFKGYSHIKTLDESLHVIDTKRQTLANPYRHSFLCLEIQYDKDIALDTMTTSTNSIADAINQFYNNDLFIISLIYEDEVGVLHSVIIISDIEQSLTKSSTSYLSPNALYDCITNSLPSYNLSSIVIDAIYVFNGIDTKLAYDSIVHLKCHAYLNLFLSNKQTSH